MKKKNLSGYPWTIWTKDFEEFGSAEEERLGEEQ